MVSISWNELFKRYDDDLEPIELGSFFDMETDAEFRARIAPLVDKRSKDWRALHAATGACLDSIAYNYGLMRLPL